MQNTKWKEKHFVYSCVAYRPFSSLLISLSLKKDTFCICFVQPRPISTLLIELLLIFSTRAISTCMSPLYASFCGQCLQCRSLYILYSHAHIHLYSLYNYLSPLSSLDLYARLINYIFPSTLLILLCSRMHANFCHMGCILACCIFVCVGHKKIIYRPANTHTARILRGKGEITLAVI